MLGCECTLGLQSPLRRYKRGRISLCHRIHGCSTPLIAFGQPFHIHVRLEELQTAKADVERCVCSQTSLSIPAEGLPCIQEASQGHCLPLPLCVTSPPFAQDPDG